MRRTPLLLLALACSHAQPEPAPLSVPAEKAAGPANLPDAGVEDAGTPDAGSADGGATRADLVSPITAAGSETPVGLEWGEKGDEPAAKIFKNVKVLGELKGNRFMAGMQSMRANLGEKCRMCHLVKQKDFANDVRPGPAKHMSTALNVVLSPDELPNAPALLEWVDTACRYLQARCGARKPDVSLVVWCSLPTGCAHNSRSSAVEGM